MSVICWLEVNSPAMVTPDILSVVDGTTFDGKDVLLNQDVCEPESQRRR